MEHWFQSLTFRDTGTCVYNSRMRKIDSRDNIFGRQDPEHSGIST